MKIIHYQISGLDYIYVEAPISVSSDGDEYIDLPMEKIEEAIAVKLIEARVPLRGAEVQFLRKTFGLSLKDWAAHFGLTAAGVMKWEKNREARLSKVNEAAVRALSAELLNIEIDSKWSRLVGKDSTPKRLSLKLENAA